MYFFKGLGKGSCTTDDEWELSRATTKNDMASDENKYKYRSPLRAAPA